MSEDGEIWEKIRQDGIVKRWKNRDSSLQILEKKGIKYQTLNADVGHYRIGIFDFWPTTGKFINRRSGKSGRGVFHLITQVEKIYGNTRQSN